MNWRNGQTAKTLLQARPINLFVDWTTVYEPSSKPTTGATCRSRSTTSCKDWRKLWKTENTLSLPNVHGENALQVKVDRVWIHPWSLLQWMQSHGKCNLRVNLSRKFLYVPIFPIDQLFMTPLRVNQCSLKRFSLIHQLCYRGDHFHLFALERTPAKVRLLRHALPGFVQQKLKLQIMFFLLNQYAVTGLQLGLQSEITKQMVTIQSYIVLQTHRSISPVTTRRSASSDSRSFSLCEKMLSSLKIIKYSNCRREHQLKSVTVSWMLIINHYSPLINYDTRFSLQWGI